MDYEQKYKQLHKFISDLYPFMSEYCKEKVEGFLPELKESEDERILEIIKHCIESRYLHTSTIKGISQKQCFAWLENLKDCEVIKKEWFEHIKKSWYKEGYIDGKYSGAKEWKKSDATILNELIDFLENGKPKLQHDLTLYANWLKKQFTPLEKQGEQKQYDIDVLEKHITKDSISELAHTVIVRNGWEIVDAKEQKPAWSEEDSARLQRIIDFLWYNRKGDTDTIYQQEQDIDWLKSLNPQSHWKPSEEQMRALHDLNLTGNISYAGQGQVLINLYNDLKKLKGE